MRHTMVLRMAASQLEAGLEAMPQHELFVSQMSDAFEVTYSVQQVSD